MSKSMYVLHCLYTNSLYVQIRLSLVYIDYDLRIFLVNLKFLIIQLHTSDFYDDLMEVPIT